MSTRHWRTGMIAGGATLMLAIATTGPIAAQQQTAAPTQAPTGASTASQQTDVAASTASTAAAVKVASARAQAAEQRAAAQRTAPRPWYCAFLGCSGYSVSGMGY